jgi:hypothetical protein
VSYKEQIKRVEKKYRENGGKWPASAVEVATWAVRKNLYEMHQGAVIRQFADQIAQVWRDEYMTDPQARRVRVKHAARYSEDGESKWLWDDMRSATHKHMELSFQHKRQQIVQDCHQLKLDVDSYNENFNKGRRIQMVFDFRTDLEELDIEAKQSNAA